MPLNDYDAHCVFNDCDIRYVHGVLDEAMMSYACNFRDAVISSTSFMSMVVMVPVSPWYR